MLAFMGNVDYDFDTGSAWKPYVGGGLGVAIISLDTETGTLARRLPTTAIPSWRIRWVRASATSFPCRRAVRSPSAWTGDTSGPSDPTFTGDVTGAEFDVEISGHDIGIGLIYGF